MSIVVVPYQLTDLQFEAYNPTVVEVFLDVKSYLIHLFPVYLIEHIGSTSVPGMSGKNSLNIGLMAEKSDFLSIISQLENVGFQSHPFKSDPDSRPLRVAGIIHKGIVYWIHLHILEYNSKNHHNSLFFREYMRTNLSHAQEYADLKRSLVDRAVSWEEYNKEKQAFIQSIISKNE